MQQRKQFKAEKTLWIRKLRVSDMIQIKTQTTDLRRIGDKKTGRVHDSYTS